MSLLSSGLVSPAEGGRLDVGGDHYSVDLHLTSIFSTTITIEENDEILNYVFYV